MIKPKIQHLQDQFSAWAPQGMFMRTLACMLTSFPPCILEKKKIKGNEGNKLNINTQN
jgi:hypothetical protein